MPWPPAAHIVNENEIQTIATEERALERYT